MDAGRRVLVEAALGNSTVLFRDFVDLVEARSGLPGDGYSTWLHTTLQRLADSCLENSQPILSALCVNADGTVAGGYAEALEKHGYTDVDVEQHACLERSRCYDYYKSNPTGQANPAGRNPMSGQKKHTATRMCPHCLKFIFVNGGGRFINHRKKGGIDCPGSAAPCLPSSH